MSEVIGLKITPTKQLYYSDETNYGVFVCDPSDKSLVEVNRNGEITIVGNTFQLQMGQEYNAKLSEVHNKQYGTQYKIEGIYEDVPSDVKGQKKYLLNLLTENQVNNIYNVYPNENVIELIKTDKFDYEKVHGIGKKTFLKIKDKIIENTEFQEAFEFLSEFKVTNNLIIKLVKHFKSAKLLIQKMKENPYAICEVNGIGFKKADEIAMKMGYNSEGSHRIYSCIEFVLEDEGNKGHTYCTISHVIDFVHELTAIPMSRIKEHIKDNGNVMIVGDRMTIKKNYRAEEYVSSKLLELVNTPPLLVFDAEAYIQKQEKEKGIKLTDQQKLLYTNIQKSSVSLLVGFAGTGKSFSVQMLIELLEKLGISYRLLSPTGKAAKILQGYTDRDVETIHRAAGLGINGQEGREKEIEEEFVIVDESSMVDVYTCSKLIERCTNQNLKMLFIGDAFQLPSVSCGNLLHDMIQSKVIPTTMLDIVFRQKEGGILDIATKIRLKQRFLNNGDFGIYEFGNNCTIASVPQDKVEGGYKYYYNKFLENFSSDEVTVASPTKKSKLGTVEINKHIQDIVNPKSGSKSEREYGFDKVIFREGDYVINIKNTYDILDENDRTVDIVNGDMGKILKIDSDEKEMLIDFGFAVVPFEFNMLGQLLHCWSMTIHKLQGSSNRAIIAIVDRAHKFQINANMLYTAVSRAVDQLVIISQAETLNYAIRKVANLQRNTFLEEMLRGRNK